MTPIAPLDPRTAQLLEHLHRRGAFDYTWAVRGNEKTSFWRTVGEGDPTLLNSQHNMYFGVHPCSAIPPTNARGKPAKPAAVRSQLAYIAAINCLFAEFDAKDFADGKPGARAHIKALEPAPSVIVDSGGGYHCYWLLAEPFMLDSDEARGRADHAQKGWVKRVGSDDGAKDLARVLRIPGTKNFKEAYAPNYPDVRFMRSDFDQLYTLDELEALIPADAPAKVRAPRTPRQAAPEADATADVELDAIAQAAANLKRLSAVRRDDYEPWIEVGMALSELGSIGFDLWEIWSRKSPKYRAGDCGDKWGTFTPRAGVTLRSLAFWADEDDPEGEHSLSPEKELQLKEYKREEEQRLKILTNETLGDREKVAWLAMWNVIGAGLAIQRAGAIKLSGDDAGRAMGRSASTGNRAIRTLEEHGVLTCDPTPITAPDGRELMQMRVTPGPAFHDLTQVTPATAKPRGGARPGAGRRPKCDACPPGTHVIRKTTVEYICQGCGTQLLEEPPRYKTLTEAEINIDFGDQAEEPSEEASAEPEQPEIKIDCIDSTRIYACRSARGPDEQSRPEVPPILEETLDLVTAIRAADQYSPPDDLGRSSYKTALAWLHKREPDKARELIERILDPQAQAIVAYLAARPTAPAVPTQ